MNELDLHGNTVHEAWKLFTDHVAKCYFDNIKSTIIITGHGKMSEELLAWVYANQHCKTARLGRNTGSFIVDVKKNKTNKPTAKVNTTVDLTPLLKKFNSY
jgi:hypothetical protein|tara:strand:- start:88 stop:390 length:303 start_codon:yes stop_codon:yes gene_type:complete